MLIDIDTLDSVRRDIRIIVNIPGRYSLASKRNDRGNRRVFACRSVHMTATAITLAAPVLGPVGERVIAHVEQFGKVEGAISRVLERGFVISTQGTAADRAKVEQKLIWLEKHKNLELPDSRQGERIVPQNPHSTLTLADGTHAGCFVIDMSETGAAVSAEAQPKLGEVLALGRAIGRVVRLFPEGFALKFVQCLAAGAIEQTIIA